MSAPTGTYTGKNKADLQTATSMKRRATTTYVRTIRHAALANVVPDEALGDLPGSSDSIIGGDVLLPGSACATATCLLH